MSRIDHETVQRILDSANIVEVVSDFVTLKRRGTGYIGLCPFHNERTPSFSVSPSRNMCKCFSCGKGGSPVNFLMNLENMSYSEALRWLAKKYGIEVKERELTDKERSDAAERESLLAVNDFALHFFEDTMQNSDEGRDIGLAYFRERGISDVSVRKFHLGYAPGDSTALYRAACEKGFQEKSLIDTGLCMRNEKGIYDRFRGRVIYPVLGLTGSVVAFGGRTLRSDKKMAKYVNSPESAVYSKKRELYGLYQARQAITRKDKVILVEGYMDVISMHQSGVENVVASSGTSLTDEQVILLRRFTRNVTVIYDSDSAGIHAALRGVDMLLEAGLNVKVLLLPDGEDPDSFAQHHGNEEVQLYLDSHETDFIKFKSSVLLNGTENDPLARARAIADIVRSISVIPDPLTRQIYIDTCARDFGLSDKVLAQQLAVFLAKNEEEREKQQQRQRAARSLQNKEPLSSFNEPDLHEGHGTHDENIPVSPLSVIPDEALRRAVAGGGTPDQSRQQALQSKHLSYIAPFEKELLRYVVRYGLMYLCDRLTEDNEQVPMSVLEYIDVQLQNDAISFEIPLHARLWRRMCDIAGPHWTEDFARESERLKIERQRKLSDGIDQIRAEGTGIAAMQQHEQALNERLDAEMHEAQTAYARHYAEKILCSDPDSELRVLATEMADDKYVLSKVHTKFQKVETEEERLNDLVPRALSELKNAILNCKIAEIKHNLQLAAAEGQDPTPYLTELTELTALKGSFAHILGDRIITPGRI